MLYVTIETSVRRRPEIVWEVLTDVGGLSAWVDGLVEAEVVGEVTSGVGTRVRVERRSARGPVHAIAEVTAWREPSLLAIETRLADMLILDRVTLTPSAEGTALGVYGEIGFGSKVVELFVRPRGLLGASSEDLALEAIYRRSVDALVKRVEAVSAIPYR